MVSIAAFQAVDPGSIPGRRNFFPLVQCPCSAILVQVSHWGHGDEVAEWLRRWTANPMGSARVGSNPIGVDVYFPSMLLFNLFLRRCKAAILGILSTKESIKADGSSERYDPFEIRDTVET